MKYKIIFLFLLLIITYSLYAQTEKIIIKTDFNSKPIDVNWINWQTVNFDSVENNYYSRVESLKSYGVGLETKIPQEFSRKNIKIIVKGKFRNLNKSNNSVYVLSVQTEDKAFIWQGLPLKSDILKMNEWHLFIDSIFIPKLIPDNIVFKSYTWNTDAKSISDIDDLSFEFKEVQDISFLQDIKFPEYIENKEFENNVIYQNQYYILYYNENNGLYLGNKENKITKPVALVCNYYNSKNKYINTIERLIFDKKNSSDSLFKFEVEDENIKNNLILKVCANSSQIKCVTKSVFKKRVKVERIALVIPFINKESEIYKNNRKIVYSNFENEYWLDKQGLKIGKDNETFYMYHNSNVSSLQYNSVKNSLVINFDYYRDHPQIYYPLLKKDKNFFEDVSMSSYDMQDSLENSFSMFVGKPINNSIRLMKNPNGFLSTYIWTEHADWTDIRTHKAVCFGSEKVIYSKDAIGGFVKHEIPVSKSVFYCNPDEICNNHAESFKNNFTTKICNIQQNPDFLSFLKDLHINGFDIAMHTPEQYTSNNNTMNEACEFMKHTFNAATWIDHGYNNAKKNNRENIVCDGLIEKSDNFSKEIWLQNGIKYFWTPYFEEIPYFTNYNFNLSSKTPATRFGNHFPNPDSWVCPSVSKEIVFWRTNYLTDAKNSAWDYQFNNKVFDEIVENSDVIINHTYPAMVNVNNGFWQYNANNEIVINPAFDNVLKLMKQYKDSGKINFTTIKDWLNYQKLIENIEIIPISESEFKIINKNNINIDGLSFSTKAENIEIENIGKKVNGDENIFWFTIKAGESKIIKLK